MAPLKGSGPLGIPLDDWVKTIHVGQKYNVDPYLLVAIGVHETQWGQTGLGRKGLILGVGAYDSGPVFTWAGLDKQLDQGAKILAAHGVHTIGDVKAGKAKFWTPSAGWASSVIQLHGNAAKWKIGTAEFAIKEPGEFTGSVVPDVVSNAAPWNAVLKSVYNMGIEAAVLLGAALLFIAAIVLLLRRKLEKVAGPAAALGAL